MEPLLSAEAEHQRRWRLILGKDGQESSGGETGDNQGDGGQGSGDGDGQAQRDGLSERDRKMDEALEALYGDEGGLGESAPDLARWLGDIRRYFSQPVAQLIQQDAMKKVRLQKWLANPDLMAEIEPDLELVSKILMLKKLLPTEARETARQVVRRVVDELREKLRYPLEQAIAGSLNRAQRSRRPRQLRDVNWLRTIQRNLKHYQVEQRTIVPETLVGYGRQRSSLRDVILCIDQSGSMVQSVVYASIFGAVMASLPTLKTRLVIFSSTVVDLTAELDDPVDLLFGLQLRGGTNIDRALAYCQQWISRPRETILVLISDLFEGGNRESMLSRARELVTGGVKVIVLLALNDQGAPKFNREIAQSLADLGVPAFACTPDLFSDLMGAAINNQDIRQWAAAHNVVTAPSN